MRGFHLIVTLGTVGIFPHLLPKVFYLRNKKTSTYFYELECINYHNVYYLFSLIDAINQTSIEKNNNRDIYENIAFGKQVIYIDPFYYTKFSEIFGRGGFCHIHEEFTNTRTNFKNILNLRCFRINRIDKIFLLVTYWILVQAMFIASLWEELIIFITFII